MIKFQCLSLKKTSQKYQFLSLNNIFDAKKPRPAPPPRGSSLSTCCFQELPSSSNYIASRS